MKAILYLFFFAGGCGILGAGIHSLVMANEVKSWPTVEGKVTYSKCIYLIGDLNYLTSARYDYAVGGKSYTGVRIAFGYSGGWWKRPNRRIADTLSSARTVLVRHDPVQPANAVLSCGLNGSIVLTLLIGGWIILVTGAAARHARRSGGTSGSLSLSWGSHGRAVSIEGIGGIVLLAAIGLALAWIGGLLIDCGILGTLVTT